ncbi:hypothetical protein BB170200_00801 [Mycobacterium marinum]|nr:hypothetical protein BB170200_00801 [Mycobacterium marinum]
MRLTTFSGARRGFGKVLAIGAFCAASALIAAAPAGADPVNPFDPADCMANADALCNLGPYGPWVGRACSNGRLQMA